MMSTHILAHIRGQRVNGLENYAVIFSWGVHDKLCIQPNILGDRTTSATTDHEFALEGQFIAIFFKFYLFFVRKVHGNIGEEQHS